MTNSTFATAATKTPTIRRTANGMKALASSLNANVDLFFNIGASRGKDITPSFERAYQEDRVTALRIVAWSRDVRSGAGERQVFRDVLKFVEKNHPEELAQLIAFTPEFGRFDDGYCLISEAGKKMWFTLVGNTIRNAQNAKYLLSKIDTMSEKECQELL